MKKLGFFVLFVFFTGNICYSQLVRKKDYDFSLALQIGGVVSLAPSYFDQLNINPLVGIKTNIPFNRKWFLGVEFNFNEADYSNNENGSIAIATRNLTVPIYVKYMLPSNINSVFGGAFITHQLKKDTESPIPFYPGIGLNRWNTGVLIGFEQQLIRNLSIALNANYGFIGLLKKEYPNEKYYPLNFGITLSYSLIRFNDCGCN